MGSTADVSVTELCKDMLMRRTMSHMLLAMVSIADTDQAKLNALRAKLDLMGGGVFGSAGCCTSSIVASPYAGVYAHSPLHAQQTKTLHAQASLALCTMRHAHLSRVKHVSE